MAAWILPAFQFHRWTRNSPATGPRAPRTRAPRAAFPLKGARAPLTPWEPSVHHGCFSVAWAKKPGNKWFAACREAEYTFLLPNSKQIMRCYRRNWAGPPCGCKHYIQIASVRRANPSPRNRGFSSDYPAGERKWSRTQGGWDLQKSSGMGTSRGRCDLVSPA
jgi:hypothetical protein